MPVELKHEHHEKKNILEESDWYTAEILGYQVLVVEDRNRVELSVRPKDYDGLRLGIFHSYPRFVSDLRKFADVAPELLRAIADALNAIGKEDLRTDFEKRTDAFKAGDFSSLHADKQ